MHNIYMKVSLKERWDMGCKTASHKTRTAEMGINKNADHTHEGDPCEQCEEIPSKEKQWEKGDFDPVDGLWLRS